MVSFWEVFLREEAVAEAKFGLTPEGDVGDASGPVTTAAEKGEGKLRDRIAAGRRERIGLT